MASRNLAVGAIDTLRREVHWPSRESVKRPALARYLLGILTSMTATFDQAIIPSNRLLRRELSAVGTYTQALSLLRREPARSLLKLIRSDHEDSVAILRAHIDDLGGEPDNHSGVWGQFARAVEGFAKMFGETTSIMALEAGEQACRDDCLRALADPEVMDEIKDDIRAILLPRIEEHRRALRSLRTR